MCPEANSQWTKKSALDNGSFMVLSVHLESQEGM